MFVMKVKFFRKKSKLSLGKNTKISRDSLFEGECTIGDNCEIINNSAVYSCQIGKDVKIRSSTLEYSVVGDGTTIGPYAHLRKDSIIGKNCKIGNFVEIKQSKVGDGTKISHLAYVGNAKIGKNCNIGCGVVFANYDGKQKHETVVGDNCFIGSNCTLIAPVTIGDNCFVCAGTVVTDSVPSNTFVIGRARQENKLDRAEKYLKGKSWNTLEQME